MLNKFLNLYKFPLPVTLKTNWYRNTSEGMETSGSKGPTLFAKLYLLLYITSISPTTEHSHHTHTQGRGWGSGGGRGL